MKKFLSVLILFTLCQSTYAGSHIGFDIQNSSYKLDGTSKANNTSGVVISPNNINYKLLYSWSFSKSFHFMLNYGQRSFTVVDDDNVIVNNEKFSSSVYDVGFKWIFAYWGAISLMQKSDFDLSYEVVNTTSIKLNSQNINYLRVSYHQLLLNLRSMILAIDINYDLAASNSYVENRTGSGMKGYLKFNQGGWGFDLYYVLQNVTKESSAETFTQKETRFGSSLYFSF